MAVPRHYLILIAMKKLNHHCDVLIVGGGISGLCAAICAARAGARVTLVDDQNEFGGRILENRYQIDAAPADQYVESLVRELHSIENVTLLPRTCAYGYLDHNFLMAVEKVRDHDPCAFSQNTPRERMWRIRAKYVVMATGAFERALVFHNNDKPGVMIASAVSAYINRYGVRPGKKYVFFTNNDSAYRAVLIVSTPDSMLKQSLIRATTAMAIWPTKFERRAYGFLISTLSLMLKVHHVSKASVLRRLTVRCRLSKVHPSNSIVIR